MPDARDSLVMEIRNLTVALPADADRAHAVSDISFDLERREILCIVGESGSGKSITARAIMGLLPEPRVRATSGSILFEGKDLLQLPDAQMRALRGRRIAMIFQEPMTALNPLKRVGRQVQEAIAVHQDIPASEQRHKVRALFDAVNLLDPDRMLRSYPHELSGGQRQRVMIAMALALEPAVLIADEPTTALDVTTQAQILALIRRLQAERDMSVIFVTHDFGVVSDIAHRVAVMRHGQLLEIGSRDAVLRRSVHPYTRTLIAAIPDLTPPPERSLNGRSIALDVRNLSKTYGGTSWRRLRMAGGTRAVDDVCLRLRKGETVGLVGESGSGKSTLARCVARLIEADSGTIELDGVDLRRLGRRALRPYRKRVQMIFQDPYGSLNPRRTAGSLIAEGPLIHGESAEEAQRRTFELLQLVGLDASAAGRYPHEFSGGQRQRIGIARALALRPEVLVADEPVSALDVSVQAQILDLLTEIRDRLELSMLFITHDLRVAAQLCDTILVMHRGVIVEAGPTANVFRQPVHAYTRELFAAVPGRQAE